MLLRDTLNLPRIVSLKSSASWWSSLRFRCMLNRKSTKKKVWARKGGLTNSSYSCVCEIIRMNLQGELRRVRILQNVWVLPYNDCLSSLEKTFQLRRHLRLFRYSLSHKPRMFFLISLSQSLPTDKSRYHGCTWSKTGKIHRGTFFLQKTPVTF